MANIQKRGKDSWYFTVSTGRQADGSYGRETKTYSADDLMNDLKISPEEFDELTPKKLEEHIMAAYLRFKAEVQSGNYITPGKMTLEKFVREEWEPKYAVDELSPTTLEVYNDHLELRILPVLGHLHMKQITPMRILSLLNDLRKPGARKDGKEGGLDIGTIQYVYRVLSNVFRVAHEWKAIDENPMDGVSKPQASKQAKAEKAKKQKEERNYYDEQEAQAVVDALYTESTKWRLFILGSMIGGFRRGELVGLEWPYVDFEDNQMNVENNIPLTKDGEAVEKEPKSESSKRGVDMPQWYMDALLAYKQEWEAEKEALGDKWEGGKRQFVFHNGTGKPYYYQHPSKWWKRFCNRHNLRYIKLHGLRHSMGTLMLEDAEGANIDLILKVIQERLGHSRKSTTEDIYVHVTKRAKKQTALTFEKFNRNPTDEQPPATLRRVK